MSTFLALCNKLSQECGVTSSASSIASTLNQSGQAKRLVDWTASAHREIQNRHDDWRWMRSTWTVNTVVGTDTYAPTSCTDSRLNAAITRFARWLPYDDNLASNVKRYLTSAGVSGEIWMIFLPWSYYRAVYKRGTQNNGPIIHFTIDPQNNFVVGPKPDDIYTASGEYMMSAFDFTADGDTPEWPSRFHDLVVYRAMEKYGRYYAAGEVLDRALSEGGRMMKDLEDDQLPPLVGGAPLA